MSGEKRGGEDRSRRHAPRNRYIVKEKTPDPFSGAHLAVFCYRLTGMLNNRPPITLPS